MKTKEIKGITLITLAITIVVLIILAGVSINAVIGDDGITKKAQNSANLTKEAEGTYTFDFDSTAKKPFQFKLKAIGSYKITVGVSTIAK